MRHLGKAAGLAILVLSAGVLSAQSPVLSSIEAPYPALQSRAKINGTWYAAGSVAYGPVGTPLLLTGSNFTSASAVTFSGPRGTTVQATPTPWTSTALVVNVPAGAVTGNVTVSSGAATSNALPFSVTSNVPYSGMCPAMPTDAQFQIVTSSLRDGTIFSAYNVSLEATGGTPPYSWSLASGVLPPGLSFSSGGTISGTPTSVTGGLNLTIAAVDSLGQTTQALFSLTIDPLPPNNGNHTVYRYSVSPGQFDSDGNILGYSDSVMGNWTFSYDTLNRLKHSSATAGDFDGQDGCWSYDSFGNRTQQILSSADFQAGSGGASACQPQGNATVATVLADFNSSNRVTSTNARGVAIAPTYDGAGNVLSDGANSYLYDPEGRICAVKANIPTGGAVYWGYLYDAEGSRVAKGSITSLSCDLSHNGFQLTEQYVSGQSGEQLAVLDGSGAWKRSSVYGAGRLLATYDTGGLHFHVTDPLGTRRVQTSSAGVAELTCENLPFGDDQNCFSVPNSSGAGDSTTLHFTGKERDAESGNDYFGARYYASSIGRFMSPDWSAKVEPVPYATLDNPQSLNLYAYMGNNPLAGVDPDGHCCWDLLKSTAAKAWDWLSEGWKRDQGLVKTTESYEWSPGTLAAMSAAVTQQGLQQAADESINQSLDIIQSAEQNPSITNDVTFTHFTDAEGLLGITGLDPASLSPGQTTTVSELNFGTGSNPYLAGQPGDNFVTDLSPSSSSLSLSQIGVFGDKQSYGISFSGTDAAAQGVLVRGQGKNIYTLPANSTLTGCFSIVCR